MVEHTVCVVGVYVQNGWIYPTQFLFPYFGSWEYMSAKGAVPGLEDCIQEYLEYLTVERQVSPFTIRNYRFYLSKFAAWLRKFYPGKELGEVTSRMLKTYRVYLAQTKDEKGAWK